MGVFDWFRRGRAHQGGSNVAPMAHSGGLTFRDLNDPLLREYILGKGGAADALFNTSVFRCVDLISGTIASLPFRPVRRDAAGRVVEATDHPLFDVLNGQANVYQTAYEFKQWMQVRALVDGDAFALVVRSGSRVVALLPQDGMTFQLSPQGEPTYRLPGGGIARAADVFHLRGVGWHLDRGLSRVRQAARAIGLARDAEDAAISVFRNGMAPGGVLEHPAKLSDDAIKRLRKSFEDRHAGPENAGRFMILEEGMKATPFVQNAVDAQQLERSKHQVEEIARVFGVPRPLMGVDDTSWGSGIEQLAILFVRFGLMPWFTAWEQRGKMTLLSRQERMTIGLDFDERELLRGSMKDQAEFFAKALGGVSTRAWMEPNEVRELAGLGAHPDGSGLILQQQGAANVAA